MPEQNAAPAAPAPVEATSAPPAPVEVPDPVETQEEVVEHGEGEAEGEQQPEETPAFEGLSVQLGKALQEEFGPEAGDIVQAIELVKKLKESDTMLGVIPDAQTLEDSLVTAAWADSVYEDLRSPVTAANALESLITERDDRGQLVVTEEGENLIQAVGQAIDKLPERMQAHIIKPVLEGLVVRLRGVAQQAMGQWRANSGDPEAQATAFAMTRMVQFLEKMVWGRESEGDAFETGNFIQPEGPTQRERQLLEERDRNTQSKYDQAWQAAHMRFVEDAAPDIATFMGQLGQMPEGVYREVAKKLWDKVTKVASESAVSGRVQVLLDQAIKARNQEDRNSKWTAAQNLMRNLYRQTLRKVGPEFAKAYTVKAVEEAKKVVEVKKTMEAKKTGKTTTPAAPQEPTRKRGESQVDFMTRKALWEIQNGKKK
jgi:hypothetical protein